MIYQRSSIRTILAACQILICWFQLPNVNPQLEKMKNVMKTDLSSVVQRVSELELIFLPFNKNQISNSLSQFFSPGFLLAERHTTHGDRTDQKCCQQWVLVSKLYFQLYSGPSHPFKADVTNASVLQAYRIWWTTSAATSAASPELSHCRPLCPTSPSSSTTCTQRSKTTTLK